MTAASAYGIQSFSTLTVGGIELFMTSEYADSYPNSFTFGFANVPLEQWVYLAGRHPSGFNTTRW